ncbi:MAG: FlgD immunoglobulin-like domain containing protein [candidate division Zixibacteria bacterium]|nr:FlgD immunoglobulin-like domain containing protein [candidate division Zixibacteria bacterium]
MRTAIVFICLMMAAIAAASDDFVYQGSFLWNGINGVVQSGDYLYCGFEDGIGVVNLTLDFTKKKLYSSMELNSPPARLHLFDTILVVEKDNGVLDLISIADPLRLRLLGSFTPDKPPFDVECIGSYLYLAAEYDGLIRYDISDPGHVVWNDSSMAGIRVIALARENSRLYALDDYNGVLIYQPEAAGIGQPIGELFLPYSGVSLSVMRDTIYAGVRPTGYMVGAAGDPEHPQYLGRRASYIRADIIDLIPGGMVLANSVNGFELISVAGADTLAQLFPLSGFSGPATVYMYQDRPYIIYPHRRQGFVAFDIGDPELIQTEYPSLVYAYPGPITQVQFSKSRLHVVGTNNWYEIYDLSDPARPVRSGRMINPPYHPAGFCSKGDTLFVSDVSLNAVFPFIDDGVGDPYSIFPQFMVADSITRPHLIPDFFSDGDLLYFCNDRVFNGTARNDSQVFPNRLRWGFPESTTSALLYQMMLYRVTDKGILNIYKVRENWNGFYLEDVGLKSLPGRVYQMLVVDTFMYAAGPGLLTLSMADPANPMILHSVNETGIVYEMQLDGHRLICAARSGLFIYDIADGIPRLLFSGGRFAKIVSCNGDLLVASDGHSVRVYMLPETAVEDPLPIPGTDDIPRLSGHPNPFNAAIMLEGHGFALRSGPVTVDVYDILGRRVRRMTVAADAGSVRMIWDGRDEAGVAAASGVYFFRASAGSDQAVFKAVLVK